MLYLFKIQINGIITLNYSPLTWLNIFQKKNEGGKVTAKKVLSPNSRYDFWKNVTIKLN